MGRVLRGIAASTYAKYASTPIPCAAGPINKIDAFINQKYHIILLIKGMTQVEDREEK
jgi:hypothetical protein